METVLETDSKLRTHCRMSDVGRQMFADYGLVSSIFSCSILLHDKMHVYSCFRTLNVLFIINFFPTH